MPRLKTRSNRKSRNIRNIRNIRKTRNNYKKLYGGRSKRRIYKRLKTRKNRKYQNKKTRNRYKKLYGGSKQKDNDDGTPPSSAASASASAASASASPTASAQEQAQAKDAAKAKAKAKLLAELVKKRRNTAAELGKGKKTVDKNNGAVNPAAKSSTSVSPKAATEGEDKTKEPNDPAVSTM